MLSSRLLLVLSALFLVSAEPGHVVLPGESRPTAGRLDEARRRLDSGRGEEAAELLRSLLDAASNDLVAVGEGRFVSARRLAHAQIAKLAPADLTAYRKKVDAQARRWLEQAEAGDDGALYRLVDEAFCSSQALRALDRLGDRAFERGRFDEAERWWRLMSPLTPVEAKDRDVAALVYPDPPATVAARVQAKQLLARIHAGAGSWKDDLTAYRKRHPTAFGALAGRKGLYADTLATIADERRPVPAASDWPTFGGDATRGRIASAPPRLLDRLSQLPRAWMFELHPAVPDREKGKNNDLNAARRLAFHPVVVGHQALVADEQHVTAHDLRTGKSSTWYDAARNVGGWRPLGNLPPIADLRFTLTVAEGCVFARLGTRTVRDVRPPPLRKGEVPGRPIGDVGESFLVSLSLTPNSEGDRRRWMVRAIDPGRKEFAVFEGAPVVHGGRVWIAATRFESDRVITAVHCYPAHPEDTTAPLLWRTDVCETRELLPGPGGDGGTRRARHHLLTLAGSKLVYCSHSGAVVALDARTGRRAWAVRYPRRDAREPEDTPSLRDLQPPLYAEGRVYVAPADSSQLLCLDPDTGATLWDRDHLDVVHLVGVGRGRLIFTTWRNPTLGQLNAGGLRAILAADGGDDGGWMLPDDGGGLVPMGRPLLVGDLVLWPTARRPFGVFAVRQEDGRQADYPALLHRVPSGNLVYANGCLLVAGAQTLTAFVPPEMLADEGEGELKLGWRRHLLDAERAVVENRPADATEALAKACDGASPSRQLAAIVGVAEGWRKAGEAEQAAKLWREVLASPVLRGLTVEDERGLPQRAAWVAQRELGERGVSTPRGGHTRGVNTPRSPAGRVEVRLAPFERFLNATEDALLCGAPGAILFRSRETGEVQWRASLPFTPIWARSLADRVLAAGAEGIAAVDRIKGAVLWSFVAPPHAARPGSHDGAIRVLADPQAPRPLAEFHLFGARLVCVQGERRLLSLDAETGVVLWERFAPGAAFDMPPPRGRIARVAPVGNDRLLVQASRQRWLLDVASGKIVAAAPSPLQRWPRAPLVLGDRVCVVPDVGRVVLLDRATGKECWTYRVPGETTRSGEPPLPLPDGDDLVVIEPLNVGYRVQKLARATGKPFWHRPPLLDLARLDAAGCLMLDGNLIHAEDGQLSAWSLPANERRWRQALPGPAPWHVDRDGKNLLIWRERAAAVRFRFRWLGAALQWHIGPLPSGGAWSVAVHDAQTGTLRRRQAIEPESLPRERPSQWHTTLSVWPTAVVDRDEAGASGPIVHHDRRGLIAAVGNRVTILDAGPTPSE